MRTFSYTARDAETKKIVHATVQADSEREAAKVLIAQNMTPLTISAKNESSFFKRLSQRVGAKDKVFFTRQLATLVEAGMPLSQSLRIVAEQTDNPKMRDIEQEIIASVEGGHSLGDSFAKHPEVFDKVYLALVRAGEISGTLDLALKRIAMQLEKQDAMVRRIRGAMYYPMIVLVVIIAVIVFMLITIVPQIEDLYDSMGQPLPLLTLIMVTAASIITNFWWLIIIGLGLGGYFFLQYLKTDSGIRLTDAIKINMPPIARLFRKLYMARLTRTAESLLDTGVQMLDALEITSEAVNNTYVSKSIDTAADRVKGGTALSKAISDQDYIAPLVPQMIKIGEQSGQIAVMLGKLASVYEDELDEEIKALSTTIEPILMVVMAVMAGGIVGAVLFPIYSLVGNGGISA